MTEDDPMTNHSECAGDAAAYVLGALDPDEAAAFLRHLETCVVCRDEVAAFEQVVDALPMAAPQYAAPAALRDRVLQRVREEHKETAASSQRGRARSRLARVAIPRRVLAAGLAVVLALAFLAGTLVGGAPSNTRVVAASVGAAQLRVAGGHGELIVEHLPPPPPGRIYELWTQRGSASPAPSTLFGVTSRGRADLGVPGSLHGISRVMVTLEPAGGSQAPTGRPLILAQLS